MLSHGFAFEFYYCGKFFPRADKQKDTFKIVLVFPE